MSHRNSFLPIISCALMAALCLLSSACASKQQPQGFITKQQVSAFLDKMDKAANNKDIDAIIPMLSKDVQFRLVIDGFGMSQTLSFNRDEYIDYSRTGFAAVDAYDYRRGKTDIKIEPDGQSATVADEVFETSTMGGKTLRSVARTTSILKLEDEKLVIARSEGAVLILKAEEKAQPARF
jgi:hypothetical protein